MPRFSYLAGVDVEFVIGVFTVAMDDVFEVKCIVFI